MIKSSARSFVKLPRGIGEIVIITHHEIPCPSCCKGQQLAMVITFGLDHSDMVNDCSEIFNWCACGHKWIMDEVPSYQPKGDE